MKIPVRIIEQRAQNVVCQADYPLDWYQQSFIPYAKEYHDLPNRNLNTVIDWMESYIKPAKHHFGDQLLLLAHYYMGGDIVRMVEHFGGQVGDSYQLALKAFHHPEKKIIVESAVHFMAESIAILANSDQKVYITNVKSGCTMEMNAKDYMVESAFIDLNQRYGAENIVPICYMNTSGRVKAMTGENGGATCTSSNVKKIFQWALKQNKKILFIPDQYMGENVACWLDIDKNNIAYWPGGEEGANFCLENQPASIKQQFDQAKLILFCSHCSVHSYMRAPMVDYWRNLGYSVIVHPECRNEVVSIADAAGSTAFIWDHVTHDRQKTKKYAIGTENHMVRNLRRFLLDKGFDIVNLGDAPLSRFKGMGCSCATMSRNDPPHLVATLDLLRQGVDLASNQVEPGDVVNEYSGECNRLSHQEQQWVIDNAKKGLMRMVAITESE